MPIQRRIAKQDRFPKIFNHHEMISKFTVLIQSLKGGKTIILHLWLIKSQLSDFFISRVV